MSEVVLENLTKTFPNGVQAVRDLCLAVAPGELLTLIGPSGCGKTTTLRLIAGLEEPTAGTIRLKGQIANRLPPRARDVALVFQRHNLYPHLTVRRNLAFSLELHRPEGRLVRWFARWLGPARRAAIRLQDQEIAARVEEAARMLDLQDLLDRRPFQLSGGQQQRAALGRAVVRRPAVWLLDEPLSHLDAPLRAELRRQLHLLHRRLGATMIYVTHDPLEAMTLGDRLAVLDRGVVQQVGPPGEVYRHPRNRFVAGFVGWPPMSFVGGRVVTEDGGLWFRAGGDRLPLPRERAAGVRWPEGGAVTLGIRPEAVTPGDDGAALSLEVILTEPLGGAALVACRRGPWELASLWRGDPVPAAGERVGVRLDMNQAYWFDATTGSALNAGAPAG